MSIQTELTRITNAKAAIKTAIEGKGVTVPYGTLLDGMASLIESIEAGGGGGGGGGGGAKIATGSFTNISQENYSTEITHGLGTIPKIVIILWDDITLNSVASTYFYIGGFAYQDGEFNNSVKMLSVNPVYQNSYMISLFCCKLNDVNYYNGFDIRGSSPNKYCSIYNVNEDTFSVDTRLNTLGASTNIHCFATGGTYKWLAI